jgi:hypothetical protein
VIAVEQRTDLSRGLEALTDPGRVMLARGLAQIQSRAVNGNPV